MLVTTLGLRRAAAPLASRAQQSQRRFGGSLHKNKHIEARIFNYSNWRGDSEKRFKFDRDFFTSTAAWGILPFGLYYFVAADERRNRDANNGIPNAFRQ
ncbi:hypothetical protein PybrP1_001217 [[Pythium] brassicae (nom. inval.)]|nr:hypothetical protein PybrP1_001217 [[Pythium] brassicae (nom. inval.)]